VRFILIEIPLLRTLKRPYVLLLGSTAEHKECRCDSQAAALNEAGIVKSERGSSHGGAASALSAKDEKFVK
jgi:hypothetical protein